MNGQAVDRHLFGLRLIAQEAGMEVPELFKDEAYLKSSNFCLSTSSSLVSVTVCVCVCVCVCDGGRERERMGRGKRTFFHQCRDLQVTKTCMYVLDEFLSQMAMVCTIFLKTKGSHLP